MHVKTLFVWLHISKNNYIINAYNCIIALKIPYIIRLIMYINVWHLADPYTLHKMHTKTMRNCNVKQSNVNLINVEQPAGNTYTYQSE